MATGPTQNYAEADSTTWRPRPVLAMLVRASVSAGPLLMALAVGAGAAHWLPASRIGFPWPLWLLLVVAVSSGVLVICSRWLRRLVPLSALLRLSLVLPDRVPSRFEVARRTWSPSALQTAPPTTPPTTSEPALAEAPSTPEGVSHTDHDSAEWLMRLVSVLAAHDARTRAHGERVQAYAVLIGQELGLGRHDVDRLGWAALLHDVGKVHVPVDIINKNGRPTEQEWATLQQHPCHGGRMVQPLRGWLGPWLEGVEQHHERWDGEGYPHGLAGEEVSLAARIIAVADTYDVITSARAYKKPLSAEAARIEITRCAGAQFDPTVVRAFLSVSIGRLRLIAGPATLLAALPGVGAVPAQAFSTASALAQTAGGQALSILLTAGLGVVAGATATQAASPAAAAAPTGTAATSSASGTAGTLRSPGPTGVGGAASPDTSLSAALPTSATAGASTTATPAATSATTPAIPSAASRTPDAALASDSVSASRAVRGATATTATSASNGDDAPRPSTSHSGPVGTRPAPTTSPTAKPTTAPTTTTSAPAPAPTTSRVTSPAPSPVTSPVTSPSAPAPSAVPTAAPPTTPAPSTTSTPTTAPSTTPTASPTGTPPTTTPAPTTVPSPTRTAIPAPTPSRTTTPPLTPAPVCIGILIQICLP